jgi:hypothetical protein
MKKLLIETFRQCQLDTVKYPILRLQTVQQCAQNEQAFALNYLLF